MKTRNGKIARLPQQVREELNLRLERSERSPQLLAWLNALPEVQALVQGEFSGKPVNKQSLSRWRLGGYQDWLTRRDFFDDARTAEDFASESGETSKSVLADSAATVLAARYAGLMARWDGQCTQAFEAKARVLNGVCVVLWNYRGKHIGPSGITPPPRISPSHGQSRSVTVINEV